MKAFVRRLLEKTPYRIISTRKRRGVSLFIDLISLLGYDAELTIFDVGANVGQTTLAFRKSFPNSSIHAFEPVDSTFAALQRSIAGLDKVFVNNVALGASASEVVLHFQNNSQINSLTPTINVDSGAGTQTVRVNTVTDYCAAAPVGHIHVLKTDTEGFDLEVLKGAEELLRCGQIDFIYSEIGVHPVDTRHTPLVDLLQYLYPFRYYLFGLYELPLREAVGGAEYCNALFVRADFRV